MVANPLPLRRLLEGLCGQPAAIESDAPERAEPILGSSGIGFSQFNELLLLLGFDRVSDSFFSMAPIEPIKGEDKYYLGYIIERQLKERLAADSDNAEARSAEERRRDIVAAGIRNHEAYLASDHMDVYVATSMRERFEYYLVNAVTVKIFSDARLRRMKLRWFDPTQAYCTDRLDKGLSEALMLKRAKCTLYLAQETDTLGKDSELASTLAQGKPVVAFVPKLSENDDTYLRWILEKGKLLYPEADLEDLLQDQLKIFAPELAWKDQWV